MRLSACLLLIIFVILLESSSGVAVTPLKFHERLTIPHSKFPVTTAETNYKRFLRSCDKTDKSDITTSEQRAGVANIVKSWAKTSQFIKSMFNNQETKAKELIQSGASFETLYQEKIRPEYAYKALGFGDDMAYTAFMKLGIEDKRSFISNLMKDAEKYANFQWWQDYEIFWYQKILQRRFSNKA
ncbi:Putative RxLR effector [Phytophthora palmivora]|uniref:RxLR effector protein n=1 Tax=Phytophthora palmivora TaxID=4796 RepID=A0A2P4YL15_9STRA|nr:Putative RxLR effector [Phytophthora palmivora]